mgnify:CR=1 FL=1
MSVVKPSDPFGFYAAFDRRLAGKKSFSAGKGGFITPFERGSSREHIALSFAGRVVPKFGEHAFFAGFDGLRGHQCVVLLLCHLNGRNGLTRHISSSQCNILFTIHLDPLLSMRPECGYSHDQTCDKELHFFPLFTISTNRIIFAPARPHGESRGAAS